MVHLQPAAEEVDSVGLILTIDHGSRSRNDPHTIHPRPRPGNPETVASDTVSRIRLISHAYGSDLPFGISRYSCLGRSVLGLLQQSRGAGAPQ